MVNPECPSVVEGLNRPTGILATLSRHVGISRLKSLANDANRAPILA
jgi:hypothetical protein